MNLSLLSLPMLLISLTASAQSASWELVKKTAGPAQLECAPKVQTNATNSNFTLTGENMYVELDRLGQGVLCSRRQNGGIFGRLSCSLDTVEKKANAVTYGRRQCSSDLPVISRCNPRDFTQKIVIRDRALVHRMLINWQDDPVLECQYKLAE